MDRRDFLRRVLGTLAAATVPLPPAVKAVTQSYQTPSPAYNNDEYWNQTLPQGWEYTDELWKAAGNYRFYFEHMSNVPMTFFKDALPSGTSDVFSRKESHDLL